MPESAATGGIFEFVFGAHESDRERLLRFWKMLGFEPLSNGEMSAAESKAFYGHDAALSSVRLRHPGCETASTGFVRLQFWSALANEGLAGVRPIETGSRWMGIYTHDILQLRNSFENDHARDEWDPWISPPVDAPLINPPPPVTFFEPLVGLRELLVFCADFRLAFIQRAGFDRPGFGTFDDSLPYKNTEGTHANIVQPANSFDTDFYKTVFSYETAPFGDANDSGHEPPTMTALNLRDGETFRVERTRAVDCPTGLLQVYSSYREGRDFRDRSRAGSRGLCLYSVAATDLHALTGAIEAAGGRVTGAGVDEFGAESACFEAPDGYSWLLVGSLS